MLSFKLLRTTTLLVLLVLLSIACTKEEPSSFCYECFAKDNTIHVFFCNYSEEDIQNVISYWKTSTTDTMTMRCKKVYDHVHY